MQNLTPMLTPRRVAIIGASATRMAQGNAVIANLRRGKFPGEILLVHPRADVVDGLMTVPTVRDLPRDIDVAVACVSASSLEQTLDELEAVGCRSAITVAAGFTDDEASRLRKRLMTIDMAVSGPNSMGIINLTDSIPLYTARYREDLPRGPVALLAQSGSAAIALSNYPGIGFSKVVTIGNEFHLVAADYLEWLATDPHTKVVGLVAESIREPNRFEAAVSELRNQGKSLVVLKVGRSAAGAQAAVAHTGAIIGRNEAFDDYFRRLGVTAVRDYDELGAALQCLTAINSAPRGRRVGIISISGGQGALACDVAEEEGVELATLTPATTKRIEELLPGSVGRNPLDLGASVGTAEFRQEAMATFLADEGVDAVAVVQDAQATLPIHAGHDYLPHLDQVVAVAQATEKPLVLISSTAADTHPMLSDRVAGTPVPLLRGLRTGLGALRAVLDSRESDGQVAPPQPAPLVSPARLAALKDELAGIQGVVPRALTMKLLQEYGVPFVASAVVEGEAEAIAAAGALGYPLVVKAVSPGLSHKSDVGGVITGVGDESALRAAITRMRAAMEGSAGTATPLEGFELQAMVDGGFEAVVGFTTDSTLGPVLMVGSGGVLVEISDDHASRLAPIFSSDAEAMIRSTRLGRQLAGYRNASVPTDLAGLATVLCRLSQLAVDFSGVIAEADLNPVIITEGSGVATAVDALFILAAAERDLHDES